jgi:hypothetical protein
MRLGVRIGQGYAQLLDGRTRTITGQDSHWTKFGISLRERPPRQYPINISPLPEAHFSAIIQTELYFPARCRLYAGDLKQNRKPDCLLVNNEAGGFRNLTK